MKNGIKWTESAPAPAGGHTIWNSVAVSDESQNPYSWFIQDQAGNVIAALLDTTSETERDLIASAPALLAERDRLREALRILLCAIPSAQDCSQITKLPLVMSKAAIRGARAALAEGGK